MRSQLKQTRIKQDVHKVKENPKKQKSPIPLPKTIEDEYTSDPLNMELILCSRCITKMHEMWATPSVKEENGEPKYKKSTMGMVVRSKHFLLWKFEVP